MTARSGLFLCCVALGWAGCSATPTVDRHELLVVPVPPALDRLDEPIRLQYQERRAALDAKLADAAASSTDLASAFGELGMWASVYLFRGTAEPALRNAESLAPQDWRWSYYLGRLYQRGGDADGARAAFGRVLARAPADVPTLVWLGEVELVAHRAEEARRRFETAVGHDPACARALVGLGRVALEARDYPTAHRHFEAALAIAPDVQEIHYSLGLAYRGRGDLARAQEHLQLGVAQGGAARRPVPLLDPLGSRLEELNASADFHAKRARESLDAGRIDEGVEHYRAAVAAAPEKPSLRLNLGNALVRAEQPAAALEEYREALRLDPANASAHFNLALILEHQQQGEEALEHYRRALAADPGHARAHYRLGVALAGRGERTEALPHFDAAVQGDPKNEAWRLERAAALLELGSSSARPTLDTDVLTLPLSAKLRLLLARSLLFAPEADGASRARALTLARAGFDAEPSILAAETLAMVHAALGDRSAAVAWERAALAAAESQPASPATLERVRQRVLRYSGGQPAAAPWAPGEPSDDARRVSAPETR